MPPARRQLGIMSEPARPPAPIKTPCIKVCIVDGESGLCLGCYRTLNEVAAWTRFSDEKRERLMAELPARRGRIRPEKLGLVG
jgi:predicted Fe-S protein YdhL (DUF1289 family)